MITLATRLDFETTTTHALTISASDLGLGSLTSYAKVVVTVEDVNDNPPLIRVISASPAEIAEHRPPEEFVAQLTVDDADSPATNGPITCHLDGSSNNDVIGFRLVKVYDTIYRIVTDLTFDREEIPEYSIQVVCVDSGAPTSLEGRSDIITVKITDINDMSPKFARQSYVAAVEESVEVGTVVLAVEAVDGDVGVNAVVSYRLRSFDRDADEIENYLRIDNRTGLIRTCGQLDHENRTMFMFDVVASDR